MNQLLVLGCLLSLCLVVFSQADDSAKKIVNVELGDSCTPGAAPVGPGGSWQVVEKNVDKRCPSGSSCRRGACNCDDLADGTIMSTTTDGNGNRVCRRIAGQSCTSPNQCFHTADCTRGKCVCNLEKDSFCVDFKMDITILN